MLTNTHEKNNVYMFEYLKRRKINNFQTFFLYLKRGEKSNIGHGFLFLFLLHGEQLDLIKANNSSIIIKTLNKACKYTMNINVDGKKIKMMCKLRWRAKYIIQIFIPH
jgi:hypothetical protein